MRIDHKLQRVQVDSFEISDELVYRFFVSLPENERETALLRAIRIGVLAIMEDRYSAFLSKTTDDLGVQLENLKLLFDMKQEVFHKTAMGRIEFSSSIRPCFHSRNALCLSRLFHFNLEGLCRSCVVALSRLRHLNRVCAFLSALCNHNPAACIKMVQENGEEAAKVNRYV